MTVATRVTPVPTGTRPELAAIEATIAAQRGRVSLLYQVLLNSPPIADGWEKMLTAVRDRTTLPAEQSHTGRRSNRSNHSPTAGDRSSDQD